MTEHKTIYAIVRLDDRGEWNSCHVYAKTTSNLEVMKKYVKEIAKRYPTCKVYLTSRENAKKIHNQFAEWYRKQEDLRWEIAFQNALRK